MRFDKGLHLDNDILFQPQNTYRWLLNGGLNKERGAVVTEVGTSLLEQVPIGYEVIGSISLNDDRVVIFSCQTAVVSPNPSEIGVYDIGADAYTIIFATSTDLDFVPSSPIQAEFRVNIKGEVEVYWVRDNGPPGFINIDNLPAPPTGDNTRIFPLVNDPPLFTFEQIQSTGGLLEAGAYQFALAYVGSDLSVTNYLYVSNPIYVAKGVDNTLLNYDGDPPESKTGATIEFNVANLDGNFDSLRVAVIKDSITVTILPDRTISSSSQLHYNYTGGESYIPGSIDEVIIDQASYSKAEAIAQIDGTLYLGNLDRNLDIGYQKYANNIELVIESVHGDVLPEVTENNRLKKYLNPIYLHKFRTFRRGEVVAVYISWLLKDGTETKAYHIPGRELDPGNSEDTSITSGNVRDKIGQDIFDWQINARKGTVSGDTGVLNTGFWENANEFYPNTDDYNVYDVNSSGVGIVHASKPTLRNKNVRHHRMPENFDYPYYAIPDAGGASDPNLVKNGGFDGMAYWVPDGEWDIDGAVASKAYCDMTGQTDIELNVLSQSVDLIEGVYYDIAFTIDANAGSRVTVRLKGTSGAPHSVTGGGPEAFTDTILAGPDTTTYNFEILPSKLDAGIPTNEFIGTIDTVSVKVNTSSSPDQTTVLPIVPVIKNIKIPEDDPTQSNRDLLNEVTGYKIYYAKKDNSNQLILDQASTIPATKDGDISRHRQLAQVWKNDGSVLLPHGYHKDFNLDGVAGGISPAKFIVQPSVVYIHPFSSLINEASLAGATFVKKIAEYSHPASSYGGSTFGPATWLEPSSGFTYAAINDNYAIKGIGFVPHNHGEVRMDEVNIDLEAVAPGTVNRLNNRLCESKYVIELKDDLGTGEKFQINLCQFKEDVHNEFDQQELVFTGVMRTDTSSLGSGGSHVQDLIGGDIVIAPYYFSAATPWSFFHPTYFGSAVADPTDRAWTYIFDDWPSLYSTEPSFEDDTQDGAVDDTHDPLREYVIAIGLISFEVGEYKDNPLLRHIEEVIFGKYARVSFEIEGEDFGYPQIQNITVPDVTQFTAFPVFQKYADFYTEWNSFYEQWDNPKSYNPSYSLLNTTKPAFPYGPNSQKFEVEDFSTRIIRSLKDEKSFANASWRTFLESDRFDFPRNKGAIIKLSSFQNRLLVHMEKTLHIMSARGELVTSDQRAFIGTGDIFTAPPQEIVDTEGGYAGLQDPLGAVMSQFGYFFIDRGQQKVFLYTGKLAEISLAGVRNYFQANIEIAGKVIVGVDKDQNRLFLTHLGSTDWTISYLADVSSWEGFHSYIPDHYIIGTTPLITTKGRDLWEHGLGDIGKFYGTVYNFEIHFADNLEPAVEKTASTLKIDTRIVSAVGVEDTEKTFDTFRIYNDRQDTTTVTITYFDQPNGNARRTLGRWSINGFRDETNIDGASQIPSWAQRRRLSSKYNVVELVYDNTLNKKLSLLEAGIGYKPSNR